MQICSYSLTSPNAYPTGSRSLLPLPFRLYLLDPPFPGLLNTNIDSRYLSCILLLVPISVTHTALLRQSSTYALSQSYYYAFIACILYFIISTLLLINVLGASRPFNAYEPSFSQLSTPQRTIMLQTILFSAYLPLGGGIFAAIEGWDFVDGVYWADYTLLTIGLGSDFPVTKVAARMLVMPYAALGIVFIGLVIGSVRELVLEPGKARITKRRLAKERERWEGIIDQGDESEKGKIWGRVGPRRKLHLGKEVRRFLNSCEKFEAEHQEIAHDNIPHDYKIWRKRKFELMRYIEKSARRMEGYVVLGFSIFAVVIVWIGGSLVFWACELSVCFLFNFHCSSLDTDRILFRMLNGHILLHSILPIPQLRQSVMATFIRQLHLLDRFLLFGLSSLYPR